MNKINDTLDSTIQSSYWITQGDLTLTIEGNFIKTENCYKKAIELEPNNAIAHNCLHKVEYFISPNGSKHGEYKEWQMYYGIKVLIMHCFILIMTTMMVSINGILKMDFHGSLSFIKMVFYMV